MADKLHAQRDAGDAAAIAASADQRQTAIAATQAAIKRAKRPIAEAEKAATDITHGLDQHIRELMGPLPWVRYTGLGQVVKVFKADGYCTVTMSNDPPGAEANRRVRIGAGTPKVGQAYPIFQPYQLPPVEHSLLESLVPAGDPFLHALGGQQFFYACGRVSPWPPFWPDGGLLAVQSMPWPLPTDLSTPLTAEAAGGFDFTSESHDFLPGGQPLGAAQFLGVDGHGNIWASFARLYDPGLPVIRPDNDFNGFSNPPLYKATLGCIPAYGTGTPLPHQPCPANVLPRTVDPGSGHLLGVSEGHKSAKNYVVTADFFRPPGPETVTTFRTFSRVATIDYYAVDVGQVDDAGLVTWAQGQGHVSGEGDWRSYYVEYGSKLSASDPWVKISSTDGPWWPATYHELIRPGQLFGFNENAYFAYRPPGAPLLHAIWSDASTTPPTVRWRAACQTYPTPESKDGPIILFDEDGSLIDPRGTFVTYTIDGTAQTRSYLNQILRYEPVHQELRETARWPTALTDDGALLTHAAPGLPYMLYLGPNGALDWVILSYFPSRALSDTHDTTDLLANIKTVRSTTGLAGTFAPFPKDGQFVLSRIIAVSQDGTQILAEDQNGTYDPDSQTMSAGRLWQSTDGGDTWDLLPYRVTDLPAPAGLEPHGYGFIVEAS